MIDDKRRLTFITKNLNSIKWTFEYGWMVRHNGDDFTSHRGLRVAIDKAIRNGKKKVKRQ